MSLPPHRWIHEIQWKIGLSRTKLNLGGRGSPRESGHGRNEATESTPDPSLSRTSSVVDVRQEITPEDSQRATSPTQTTEDLSPDGSLDRTPKVLPGWSGSR